MTQDIPVLDRRMLEFNLLPSLALHPDRHAEFGMPFPLPSALSGVPDMARRWHRHWSRDILVRLGLVDRPVVDTAQPELALALLPPERLAVCARLMGAVLCAPRLRRAISGVEVRALIDAVGVDALEIARREPGRLHPGLADSQRWSLAEVAKALPRLGYGALRAALQQASPELRMRAELRLPPDAGDDPRLSPDEALLFGLDILESTDPTWHSSFPATH